MKKILFVFIICGMVFWIGRTRISSWIDYIKGLQEIKNSNLENYNSTICFSPVKGKWMEISERGENLFRVICTPVTSLSSDLIPEQKIPFSVRYQFLDQNRAVVSDRLYHFSTSMTPAVNPDTGRIETASFLGDFPQKTLLDNQIFLINSAEAETEVPTFRFRVEALDKAIDQVLFRIYTRTFDPNKKNLTSWIRLNLTKKENLAEKLVFPADFISDYEKANLASQNWTVLAPTGVPDKDYATLRLYIHKTAIKKSITEMVYPLGLVINPDFHGMVPLPGTGGHFLFQFEPVPSAPGMESETQPGETILFKWRGRKKAMTEERIAWDGRFIEIEKSMEGGECEIIPPEGIILRVFHLLGDQPVEITPDPPIISSYQLGADSQVQFSLNHVDQNYLPFRIDLRSVWADSEPVPQTNQVTFSLTDGQGNVVHEGVILCNFELSEYSRVIGIEHPARIGTPQRYYFSIPPQAVLLTLKVEAGDILVNGYNRPDGLVARTEIPNDFFAFHRLQGDFRNWFTKTPSNKEILLQRDKEWQLEVQNEPEDDDPMDFNLQDAFESLVPDFPPPARVFFVLREQLPLTPVANPQSYYSEMSIKGSNKVRVWDPVRRLTEPELLVIPGKNQSTSLVVFLDQKPLKGGFEINKMKRIRLGPVPSGPHVMAFDSDKDVKVYMNQIADFEGTGYLRKTVYPFVKGKLSFSAEKTTKEERLFIRVYTPSDLKEKTILKVQCSGNAFKRSNAVFNDWSLDMHEFTFDDTERNPALLPETNQVLFESEVAVIPLHEDLRDGAYKIVCEIETGSPVYISVVRASQTEMDEMKAYYEQKGEKNVHMD